MKKLRYAAYTVAAGLALSVVFAGCSAPPPAHSNKEPIVKVHEISKKLVDGRTVICLYTESFVVGGYSNVRSSVFDLSCLPPRTK
jgi:hypothetical protein